MANLYMCEYIIYLMCAFLVSVCQHLLNITDLKKSKSSFIENFV